MWILSISISTQNNKSVLIMPLMQKEIFVSLKTIVTKEVKRFMRIWVQTLIPPAVTMVLYFIIFGNLVGNRIGEMQGITYITFIVPGLIMMSVITNAYSNVVSSFFSNKFQHSIEELLVSPTPNWVILLGFVLGGALRGLAVGTIVTVLSLFFTELQLHHLAVTIAILTLTAILFAIAGFINAIYAKSFDDITVIPNFVLTPLTYLGGVFYSIELLPEFWRYLSMLNPILYMVNTFRYGLIGFSDINVHVALGVITLFVIFLFSFALYLLNKGIGIKQ